MARLRYLLLLAFIALALSTFVLAENDDDNTPETSTTASGSAELDERIKEHIRIAHDRNEAATRNAANDLSGLESPQATSTADADYDESPDSVDGVNRHHCHSCEKKEKKNECCCKHQPTPTYHISLCKQDERYKTISLPAQGRPFNYNDDVRHSSPPPLIKPFCTHGYCYEPYKHKGHKNKHKGHKGHKGKHDDDY
ncbi:hypothetical protein LPJ74_006077 [Coemansia sp. RSA 1843]|nr:hypothetical protein LPJ74_006077 [Coemansia sp. RSA 1843]